MSLTATVSIFWTGGYDSTFRICQLSRQNVTIVPYYLSDDRAAEPMELQAIDIIRRKLLDDPATKAAISPLIYVPSDARQRDSRVSEAFHRLSKGNSIGSQYEWLGAFALTHPGIELSVHQDDKAIALIQRHGALTPGLTPGGTCYALDRRKSSEDIVALFGCMGLPLADYTKLRMKREYARMGLADIIHDTWFCHRPVDGKPCGVCNSCRCTIEEGMSERFSEEALARYRRYCSPAGILQRKTGALLRALNRR
ncbi:MAG: hypothetical protein IJT95_04765 [Abditibacteriota bacterium]|nr:hypothetical protein [Abditibacteriota bacterium]